MEQRQARGARRRVHACMHASRHMQHKRAQAEEHRKARVSGAANACTTQSTKTPPCRLQATQKRPSKTPQTRGETDLTGQSDHGTGRDGQTPHKAANRSPKIYNASHRNVAAKDGKGSLEFESPAHSQPTKKSGNGPKSRGADNTRGKHAKKEKTLARAGGRRSNSGHHDV